MREPVLLRDKLLDRAIAESDFYNKRARFATDNAHSPVKRGIGIASFLSWFRFHRFPASAMA